VGVEVSENADARDIGRVGLLSECSNKEYKEGKSGD